MQIIYHIFTHEQDEYVDDLKTAKEIFKDFVEECGCARLYEETWEDTKNDDEPIKEDCIKSVGEYPM